MHSHVVVIFFAQAPGAGWVMDRGADRTGEALGLPIQRVAADQRALGEFAERVGLAAKPSR